MPTIDDTVGGASANSYSSVADADTYFDERLQASNWTGESDADVKERALIMATRQIDVLTYRGFKNSSSQALKWPRSDVYDEDGNEYETDAIPTIILHATYETALEILNDNADSSDPFGDLGLRGFDRAKVGPIEVEPNHGERHGGLSDRVLRMLAHVRRGSGIMATLERG